MWRQWPVLQFFFSNEVCWRKQEAILVRGEKRREEDGREWEGKEERGQERRAIRIES